MAGAGRGIIGAPTARPARASHPQAGAHQLAQGERHHGHSQAEGHLPQAGFRDGLAGQQWTECTAREQRGGGDHAAHRCRHQPAREQIRQHGDQGTKSGLARGLAASAILEALWFVAAPVAVMAGILWPRGQSLCPALTIGPFRESRCCYTATRLDAARRATTTPTAGTTREPDRVGRREWLTSNTRTTAGFVVSGRSTAVLRAVER